MKYFHEAFYEVFACAFFVFFRLPARFCRENIPVGVPFSFYNPLSYDCMGARHAICVWMAEILLHEALYGDFGRQFTGRGHRKNAHDCRTDRHILGMGIFAP